MKMEISDFIEALCAMLPAEEMTNDDKAVLKVSFLISALDGTISPEEYRALGYFAGRFSGLDGEAYEALVDSMLRTAGFLLLSAGRHPRDAFLKLFVKEALAILPLGFADRSPILHRAAAVFWIAMAYSDDEYSAIERESIVSLCREFAASLDCDGNVVRFERRVSGILSCFDDDAEKALTDLRSVIDGR